MIYETIILTLLIISGDSQYQELPPSEYQEIDPGLYLLEQISIIYEKGGDLSTKFNVGWGGGCFGIL